MQRIQQIIRNRRGMHPDNPHQPQAAAPGPLNQWLAVFAPLPLAY